ncbi:pyridoxal 5'-phosphate synthase glutaminase subunit PdxT [Rothia sp. P5766]|uniref:pyridoxal 5'-phosphate synthase glutaminase subunit PdxT n=1 Tax=unclassified Rothia (in: high G+C Gram-positive bacteria) TaxID=2689056 RepID=UPI003AEA0CED
MTLTVGVLALQGGVAEHVKLLETLGVNTLLVKKPEELQRCDALVLPGGESTTIDRLTRIFGLRQPLIDAIGAGLPTLGTCAGLILLAKDLEGTAADQQTLGLLDVTVARNAFGSQIDSAEAELAWCQQETPLRAAFIRAPAITRTGPEVEVLATYRKKIVGVQEGKLLGISFHPELTGDTTVHRRLLELTTA